MTQAEQLAAQNGTEPIKPEQLITFEKMEGSPFTIVKKSDTEYLLTMGKYQIAPTFESKEEISIWIMANEFNLITTMCTIICENHKQ